MSFPNSTISVAAFIKRRWSVCRDWPKTALLQWVQWYIDHDRCHLVSSRGKLSGVALVRFVDTREQAEASCVDTGGEIAHCDLAVSKGPRSLKGLFTLMFIKGGAKCKALSWARNKYNNRITIKPMGQMAQKLLLGHG